MPADKAILQTLTLGCSKNRVDTEHIIARIEDIFRIIPEDVQCSFCDIFLINTCGFIGDAKEESIAAILEAVERKKHGEIGRIVVFGCLSQRYSAEMPDLIPEVDAWFGATDPEPLLSYLGAAPDNSVRTRRHLTTPSLSFIHSQVFATQRDPSGSRVNQYLLASAPVPVHHCPSAICAG